MTTVIRPANSEKTWGTIFGDIPEDEKHILASVLYLTAAHIGAEGKPSYYTHKSAQKRLYGKILWNYIGDDKPSRKVEDTSIELGRLMFAYYLRKVLEANPIVTRENRQAIPA